MNNEQLNGTQVPTQPNIQPVPTPNVGQPTVAPATVAPQPVQPAVAPTAQAPQPVQPAVAPTAPAPQPVQPAVATTAQAPQPVQPTVAPTAPTPQSEEIQASVINEPKEDISDVQNTTFDYNELYGIEKTAEEKALDEQLDVVEKPMFTAQEIVIDNPTVGERVREDVVPEFNINALDENANKNNHIDSTMNDEEKDKAETRRAIIWIVVLILILVVFVGFIFPIIAGAK